MTKNTLSGIQLSKSVQLFASNELLIFTNKRQLSLSFVFVPQNMLQCTFLLIATRYANIYSALYGLSLCDCQHGCSNRHLDTRLVFVQKWRKATQLAFISSIILVRIVLGTRFWACLVLFGFWQSCDLCACGLFGLYATWLFLCFKNHGQHRNPTYYTWRDCDWHSLYQFLPIVCFGLFDFVWSSTVFFFWIIIKLTNKKAPKRTIWVLFCFVIKYKFSPLRHGIK